MTTYFLSYARADDKPALRLAGDLIAAGVKVWVDQYDIKPSEHWDRAVESAVHGCEGMIVVLSPRSAASPNVADEVSVALDAGKRVIPVLIEACTPPLRMTRMQFIDARDDYDAALRRCVSAIAGETETLAGSIPTTFSPEVLSRAERRLTHRLGPIAALLVRQAAARSRSEPELYADLARSLPDDTDRRGFLATLAGAPPATTDSAADSGGAASDLTAPVIDAITRSLTRHIGPIAPQLVARERPLAASRAELCRRLAARIPSETDRAAFLKEVDAA